MNVEEKINELLKLSEGGKPPLYARKEELVNKVNEIMKSAGKDVSKEEVGKIYEERYGEKLPLTAISHYMAIIGSTLHICYPRGRLLKHWRD